MVLNIIDKENRNNSLNVRHSLGGKISIIMGIFNGILSVVVFCALYFYVNQKFAEYSIVQFRILNIGGSYELYPKIIGLMFGLLGFFEKNKKKTLVYYGVGLNGIVLLWTVALYAGVII